MAALFALDVADRRRHRLRPRLRARAAARRARRRPAPDRGGRRRWRPRSAPIGPAPGRRLRRRRTPSASRPWPRARRSPSGSPPCARGSSAPTPSSARRSGCSTWCSRTRPSASRCSIATCASCASTTGSPRSPASRPRRTAAARSRSCCPTCRPGAGGRRAGRAHRDVAQRRRGQRGRAPLDRVVLAGAAHARRRRRSASASCSTDVTERRAAERALRAQTDRYEALLHALSEAGEGLVVLERDGRCVYANAAFEQLSGYTFPELAAMDSVLDLVSSTRTRIRARARSRGPSAGRR